MTKRKKAQRFAGLTEDTKAQIIYRLWRDGAWEELVRLKKQQDVYYQVIFEEIFKDLREEDDD